jgi:hypothetical protein
MRKLFDNTIVQIIPVDNPIPLSENLPSNREEWEQFRKDIYDRHDLEDGIRDAKTEEAIIDRLLKMKKLAVHCESALISYLHRNPSFPAFSYIGVSKLSCKPCHRWLSAYNQHANSGCYYTKGSHDKWYLGWKTPLLDEETQAKVDEVLVHKVEQEYCAKEKELGKARAKKRIRSSDSSNSSESGRIRFGKRGNQPQKEKVRQMDTSGFTFRFGK